MSRNGDFFLTILTYSYLNITYIQLCVINANRITRIIINPSFMLHVPLDSIIESVIAVGGVLLWVSSVCWDTQ